MKQVETQNWSQEAGLRSKPEVKPGVIEGKAPETGRPCPLKVYAHSPAPNPPTAIQIECSSLNSCGRMLLFDPWI